MNFMNIFCSIASKKFGEVMSIEIEMHFCLVDSKPRSAGKCLL